MLEDEVGHGGYGGIPAAWQILRLSESCPSLKTLTLIMGVSTSSRDSELIFMWRYALCLFASAPPTLESLKIGMVHSGIGIPYSMRTNTLHAVNWKRWREVLKTFDKNFRLNFVLVDPDSQNLTNLGLEWCSFIWAQLHSDGARRQPLGRTRWVIPQPVSGDLPRGPSTETPVYDE